MSSSRTTLRSDVMSTITRSATAVLSPITHTSSSRRRNRSWWRSLVGAALWLVASSPAAAAPQPFHTFTLVVQSSSGPCQFNPNEFLIYGITGYPSPGSCSVRWTFDHFVEIQDEFGQWHHTDVADLP